VRTVGSHLTHVYTKLARESRSALVAAAQRRKANVVVVPGYRRRT
jgi:DNA-binding CsgD family transcriptional regulator